MESIGIVIFLLISISIACCSYSKISSYVLACLLSAFATTVLIQIINAVTIGYIDPFVIIALLIGFISAFISSAIVGFFFWLVRRKEQNTVK